MSKRVWPSWEWTRTMAHSMKATPKWLKRDGSQMHNVKAQLCKWWNKRKRNPNGTKRNFAVTCIKHLFTREAHLTDSNERKGNLSWLDWWESESSRRQTADCCARVRHCLKRTRLWMFAQGLARAERLSRVLSKKEELFSYRSSCQ